MDRQEFTRGMKILRAAYPSAKLHFTDSVMDVWFNALRDMDGEVFVQAAEKLIRTVEWFPSIAAVRAIVSTMAPAATMVTKHIDEHQENAMSPDMARKECRKVINFLSAKMGME